MPSVSHHKLLQLFIMPGRCHFKDLSGRLGMIYCHFPQLNVILQVGPCLVHQRLGRWEIIHPGPQAGNHKQVVEIDAVDVLTGAAFGSIHEERNRQTSLCAVHLPGGKTPPAAYPPNPHAQTRAGNNAPDLQS